MNDWIAEGGLLLAAGAVATIFSVVVGGRFLRHGLVIAGLCAFADAVLLERGATPMLLAGLFTLINGLAVLRMKPKRGLLDADVQLFYQRHLSDLSESEAKLLTDQGNFISARAGEQLTTQGEPVENLYFLAQGCAAVLANGAIVGRINPGDLIGEACLLDNGVASATVRLADNDCRLWFITRDRLRAFLAAQPRIAQQLNRATMSALHDKLENANRGNAAE